MLYVIKVLISAGLIVLITELSKRGSTLWGGILASLPLTSLLAFIWLYLDTRDATKIASLSWSIFWLVLPSLSLFIALPVLLRRGLHFAIAFPLSIVIMVGAYLATTATLRRFGVGS